MVNSTVVPVLNTNYNQKSYCMGWPLCPSGWGKVISPCPLCPSTFNSTKLLIQ